MGKGDKKTRRGKIQRGTFGVLRPRKKKTVIMTAKAKKAAPKKAATKPTAKKTTKADTKKEE